MDVSIQLSFDHEFDVVVLESFPIGEVSNDILYFEVAGKRKGRDGILVRVISPETEASWIGHFAYGSPEFPALTGIYSTPSRSSVFVVSKGQGYLVPIFQPHLFQALSIVPVRVVFAAREEELLVIGDNSRLAALDSGGLRWTSGHVCPDDLSVVDVANGIIYARGWDPAQNRFAKLEVEASSGRRIAYTVG